MLRSVNQKRLFNLIMIITVILIIITVYDCLSLNMKQIPKAKEVWTYSSEYLTYSILITYVLDTNVYYINHGSHTVTFCDINEFQSSKWKRVSNVNEIDTLMFIEH